MNENWFFGCNWLVGWFFLYAEVACGDFGDPFPMDCEVQNGGDDHEYASPGVYEVPGATCEEKEWLYGVSVAGVEEEVDAGDCGEQAGECDGGVDDYVDFAEFAEF